MDPLARFLADRAQARTAEDPCANLCVAATVDADGEPQARTLVLRELDTTSGTRLAIFCNETSPKWREMSNSSRIALSVFLPSSNLQYRLQCTTVPMPVETVHESWQLRPDAPKRLDWFYTLTMPQSAPIESRDLLLMKCAGLELPDPLIAPETARGLYVIPEVIERLDLNQPDGIHDRRLYQRRGEGWIEKFLVP
ncbi:MAG: pyridoxamine 5'-phosphate oxidase family protein [Gammaproteobacteria bacterium]|nr:pyridoxamine 5'-phosphate oxidase family protein [Gammaproteobacteria bacterium]